jgi:hypothetical protein
MKITVLNLECPGRLHHAFPRILTGVFLASGEAAPIKSTHGLFCTVYAMLKQLMIKSFDLNLQGIIAALSRPTWSPVVQRKIGMSANIGITRMKG